MRERTRARWAEARPGAHEAVDAACVAPWVTLELDPTGWVYACCANQLYPLGRIGEERLRDLWGGPRAQVLREALGRWDLSVGCASCEWHLDHGRMDPDAAVYDAYPVASEAPAGPVAMTFALSNRCNLGCVMCTPELSSTLRHQAGLAPIASPYDDAFFDDLAGFLPGLRYAKFLGGEPFLIPEHHRVWDLMAEVGGPPRMQVTTNATIWNARVEWLLERFLVDVTVSIDAAEPAAYESIRVGASFDVTAANVERFAATAKARGTELRLCFCLMDRNPEQLGPVLRWADRLDAPVSVNLVTDTGFALHDLPLPRLEAVLEAWRAEEQAHPIGRNAAVWDTQLGQLSQVVAERRGGAPIPPRQAQPAGAGVLLPPAGEPSEIEPERARLDAWSGGGPVGQVDGTADGTITRVAADHPRLGVAADLVGSDLDGLLARISQSDGRPAWLVGRHHDGPVNIDSLVLDSGRPRRGRPGSVVRLVGIPTPTGFTMLVAEDRMYDHSQPVAITTRR